MPTKLMLFVAALIGRLLCSTASSAPAPDPVPPPAPSTGTSAHIIVAGAGATFPSKLYQTWFEAYGKLDPSVQFTYDASGSGAGQRQIVDQAVDFGASDGPLSDAVLARAPGRILHVPTVAGAIVMSCNLPGIDSLRLDGATLADIFLGKITLWNDPAIARQNQGVKLPEMDIVTVHRTEESGSSFIFSDYLSAVSPEWNERVGKGTTLNWPVGLGAAGSGGVSAKVRETPGSIGYFELVYAMQNHLPQAEIKNREGYYIRPTLESVTAAVATIKVPDDFRFSMVNAPGRDAYPLCSATWLLIYEKPQDAAKGRKLLEFIKWAETEGVKMTGELDFAPLPESLRDRVLHTIGAVKP